MEILEDVADHSNILLLHDKKSSDDPVMHEKYKDRIATSTMQSMLSRNRLDSGSDALTHSTNNKIRHTIHSS